MVANRLTLQNLASYMRGIVSEVGTLEAWFCNVGHALGTQLANAGDITIAWHQQNHQLSARKPARESRLASLAMGRRMLGILHLLYKADLGSAPAHYCLTFGLAGGLIGASATATTLAFLQQMLTGQISAAQRLMSLGQMEAQKLSWRLKASLVSAATVTGANPPPCCAPLLEVGSMQHPWLSPRLFIS